ncbi:MAG: helix-turn-helix domain-containing protein, partial [Bradyrhizobium sp.]
MSQQRDFAASLRWWRQRKGHSQLELAGRADISQRHLSFLELGAARPSSRKLRLRCEMSARPARSSWEWPLRCRPQRRLA